MVDIVSKRAIELKMLVNKSMKQSWRGTFKNGSSTSICFAVAIVTILFPVFTTAFLPQRRFLSKASRTNLSEAMEEAVMESQSLTAPITNPEVQSLKSDLIELADRTNRGFTASADDKRKAKDIVESLKLLQSVPEPARTYYDPSATSSVASGTEGSASSISGKWTLIYTDAPDITGLDTSRNPFSTAKLGRIGQECSPPYIKNVIEWSRPDWAKDLPFSGSDESRILQKVVTSASATPAKPTFVDLKIAGLELTSGSKNEIATNSIGPDGSKVIDAIQTQGVPAGILSINPIDLKGPLNPPFGRFEILYLDEEFRAIRTSQNFLAVNRRITEKDDEWF